MSPRVSAWIQASRPRAFHNLAVPVIFACALAWNIHGVFHATSLPWIAAFCLLAQLVVVWTNDWADAEADALHDAPTAVSGGSRVIPEGRLSRRDVGVGALLAAVGLVALGASATAATGRPVPLLAAFGSVACAALYSLPPFRLSYRGGGEVVQGLGLGLVLPVMAWDAQVGSMAAFPWAVLVPVVLLFSLTNVVATLPDVHADRAGNKRSWAVRTGPDLTCPGRGRSGPVRTWAVRTGPAATRAGALAGLVVGVALLLAMTPGLSPIARVLAGVPSLVLLAWIGPVARLPDADGTPLRFVIAAVTAVNLAHCCVAIALVA